jgi:hypothetical protein
MSPLPARCEDIASLTRSPLTTVFASTPKKRDLMSRPTIRTAGISAVLLIAGALILAPPSNADNATFIAMLGNNGIDVSNADIRNADIDLGLAICSLLNQSQSPDATVDSLVRSGNHTQRDANTWMATSVITLCPELDYITHYADYARAHLSSVPDVQPPPESHEPSPCTLPNPPTGCADGSY